MERVVGMNISNIWYVRFLFSGYIHSFRCNPNNFINLHLCQLWIPPFFYYFLLFVWKFYMLAIYCMCCSRVVFVSKQLHCSHSFLLRYRFFPHVEDINMFCVGIVEIRTPCSLYLSPITSARNCLRTILQFVWHFHVLFIFPWWIFSMFQPVSLNRSNIFCLHYICVFVYMA